MTLYSDDSWSPSGRDDASDSDDESDEQYEDPKQIKKKISRMKNGMPVYYQFSGMRTITSLPEYRCVMNPKSGTIVDFDKQFVKKCLSKQIGKMGIKYKKDDWECIVRIQEYDSETRKLKKNWNNKAAPDYDIWTKIKLKDIKRKAVSVLMVGRGTKLQMMKGTYTYMTYCLFIAFDVIYECTMCYFCCVIIYATYTCSSIFPSLSLFSFVTPRGFSALRNTAFWESIALCSFPLNLLDVTAVFLDQTGHFINHILINFLIEQ